MPANIAKDRYGFLSVYAGEKPWHPEIGSLVTGAMTAKQVIRQSRANGGKGLGFDVATYPAYAKIGGRFVESPEHRAIARTDTREVFGFASPDYKPFQNETVLRTAEAIAKTRQAGFISAGLLGNGARGFATMDLSKLVDLKVEGDPSGHRPFLTMTWSHDGTEAVRYGFGDRRVECANMRAMQIASWNGGVLNARIVHSGDLAAQTEEARRILGFAKGAIKDYGKLMNELADIAIEKGWIDGFVERLIPIPDELERTQPRKDAREAIASLFAGSKTLKGVPSTAYRVIQAVDEYADHFRPMRTADPSLAAERAMRSILGEGPAAELKARAMELIRQEFEIRDRVPVKTGK